MCGNESRATQQDDYPDNGWGLQMDAFGYYGGFSDNIRRNESMDAVLCHDCCVKVLDLFPEEFQQQFSSGHPCCRSEQPCCKYAWRGTELFGTHVKDEEGRFYSAPGVNVQHAWPDGQWHDDPPQPTHFWLEGECYLGDFVDGRWENVVPRDERDELT